MFTKIQQWLESSLNIEQSEESEHTTQLAAAMLLLEVSFADYDISQAEQQTIIGILVEQFSLSEQEAKSVLQHGMEKREDYTSAHPFICLLNEELKPDEKLNLLAGLWRVAFTDKVLDKYEEQRIRKIADWLYLSHSEFIRVKYKIMDELGLSQD
ncbi:MAG: TerB family tellurite resistance protein [Pseudomonadota bacterium]